jgi:hypothetical protein
MEKEIHSEQIKAGSRTYFFDVKQAANGSNFADWRESSRRGDSCRNKPQVS